MMCLLHISKSLHVFVNETFIELLAITWKYPEITMKARGNTVKLAEISRNLMKALCAPSLEALEIIKTFCLFL